MNFSSLYRPPDVQRLEAEASRVLVWREASTLLGVVVALLLAVAL